MRTALLEMQRNGRRNKVWENFAKEKKKKKKRQKKSKRKNIFMGLLGKERIRSRWREKLLLPSKRTLKTSCQIDVRAMNCYEKCLVSLPNRWLLIHCCFFILGIVEQLPVCLSACLSVCLAGFLSTGCLPPMNHNPLMSASKLNIRSLTSCWKNNSQVWGSNPRKKT